MEIRYLQAAAAEVREAIGYLEDRSPLAAGKFESELQDVVGKAAARPEFGYPVGGEFRKVAFRTLPWSIVYRHDEERGILWIVIVRHRLRHPSYGLRRRPPEP